MATKKDEAQNQEPDQTDKDPDGDKANAAVQDKINDETERGYRGSVPDPTPNENYTVSGVTAGKPTPETDADLAAEAAAAVRGNYIPITKEK